MRFRSTIPSRYGEAAIRCLILALALALLALSGCGKRSIKVPGTAKPSGAAVVNTARSQIGKMYKSGGTSPKTGFDCSGLIMWSYARHGVNVPRLTGDQAKAGRGVSASSMQPGDIVVFRMSAKSLHTGIYTGKGTFIHSPSSGKRVREEALNDYWKKRLSGARRVL